LRNRCEAVTPGFITTEDTEATEKQGVPSMEKRQWQFGIVIASAGSVFSVSSVVLLPFSCCLP